MLWRKFPNPLINSIRRKHFITCPIFYVNGEPHLGHLYTSVLADANFRWHQLKNGADPADLFVVGTDEHGLKVQRAAERAHKTPSEFCDFYSQRFRELFDLFGISYNKFIRTSSPEHAAAVAEFWERLNSGGHIYKGEYSGWYSIRDENFYSDAEVEDFEINGEKKKRSIESKSTVEWTTEKNYMFDWAKFREPIEKWLVDEAPISPSSHLPAILQTMKLDRPIALSRDSERLKWGLPVPGDPSQKIYVWLDALVSYMSATGYPKAGYSWPADIQFIGKDIRTFHSIYWPAFLLAADLPLPKRIHIHSHWLVDGEKMSKSQGNVVNPFLATNTLTKDGLRYFLLKQGTFHSDANFTMIKAIHTVNADLVNNLGNLITRATATGMNPKQRYPSFDVEVMEHDLKGTGEKLILALKSLPERVSEDFDKLLFYKGLEDIAEAAKNANAFFQLHKPWKMKESPDKQTILFIIYETARICNILLQPIVPDYANRSLNRLGIKKDERSLDTAVWLGGKLELYGRKLGDGDGTILPRLNEPDLHTEPEKET